MNTSDPLYQSAIYAVFFITAIIFSFLTNGLLLKFSRTLGNRQVQHRHTIRWSSALKPSVGGFSFYILFLISISTYGIVSASGQSYLNKQLLGMVFAVNTGFLLGLADDAYDTIPTLKFVAQMLCGGFLIWMDSIIPATGIYWLDVLVTLLWVVGIMNSINMLDNMDGISGIVSLFILIACLLVIAVEKNFFSFHAMLLLGVGGAVIGFLFFNWYPAQIYMGDTGSQFLGAFISAMSIQILWNYHEPSGGILQFKQYLVPLIAFTVPLMDTATVFMRRIARGQSPFIGGKDHISHHLAYAGLTERQVIYALGGWSLLSAVFAALLIYFREQLTTEIIAACYSYLIVMFLIVQYFYNSGKKKLQARLKAEEQEQKGNTHSAHSATA